MVKVGFQGNHGTFSEMAVRQFFNDVEEKGYPNFIAIIEALEKGEIDYGMFPVENTTTGIIARTYDLFKSHDLFACGEVNVTICDDLIVVPSTKMEQIKEVYSHPEALEQCAGFFASHPSIKKIAYQDTAKSVEYIKECNDPSKAALASRLAAQYYQMESLIKDVQDNKFNVTRFLCMSTKKEVSKDANKISMMFTLKHEPGALSNVLDILKEKDINILKLESRPIIGQNFEYCFYMDFDGNITHEDTKEVLDKINECCLTCKIMGCYPKAKQ